MAPRLRSKPWDRSALELHGRAAYHNWETDLLIRSQSELGVFPHNYLFNGRNCKSHPQQIIHEVEDSEADTSDSSDSADTSDSSDSDNNYGGPDLIDRKNGVSALTFDKQGRYLAAGTRAGCLTVYDFESLYCHTQDGEDQSKQLAHRSNMKQIDAIKWNPADQNEIACVSRRLYDVNIFDCDVLTRPKAVCQRRRDNHNCYIGLSDVAFALTNSSCIVASDLEYPTVGVWDTRERGLPICHLKSGLDRSLNSIQYLDGSGDQILVGGGSSGYLCLWDLRSGDANPIQQWELRTLLEAQNLNEGAGRLVLDIVTIGFNPSNQTQLAFHVCNGWSGIFDLHSTTITHIHRPHVLPGIKEACRDPFCLRRSSWLSNSSIYLAPARNESGIFLLDFHRSTSSPYHVDSVCNHQDNNQSFMALSQTIITCAAHPRCGAIVAGTEDTSLLLISEGRKVEGEEGRRGSGR